MPGALWIGPTGNRNPGAELDVRGLVLHVQQGTEAGTEAWQHNPASHVSSHFLTPRAGGLRQMVDTADKAWCEVAGNAHWISVECEGWTGQPLTGAQVADVGELLAWLHRAYAVRLVAVDDPNAGSVAQGGLGYHAMGGRAWGNHPDCPGGPIIAQRADIIARAAIAVGTAVPPPQPRLWTPPWPGRYLRFPPLMSGADVRSWQAAAKAHGAAITVDGWYGPRSRAVCLDIQRRHRLAVDGIVGPLTWRATWLG